jgi:hypothetical protein
MSGRGEGVVSNRHVIDGRCVLFKMGELRMLRK